MIEKFCILSTISIKLIPFYLGIILKIQYYIGCSPSKHSVIITPKLHKSESRSYFSPSNLSGDIYIAVPT